MVPDHNKDGHADLTHLSEDGEKLRGGEGSEKVEWRVESGRRGSGGISLHPLGLQSRPRHDATC